jgi:signal recognition particle subunit SRP54
MAAKLAAFLKKRFGKSPLVVACDIYRPAAIKQLQVVGQQVGIPVFERGQQSPLLTADEAIAYAKAQLNDLVIFDTAGRLHIDDDMMAELKALSLKLNPAETLLVVDAMTGQDAVNAAKAFDEALALSGVILTKLDGDARGGAALSIRAVTGKPIKFCSVGEKLGDIEPFYPDRMAGRILGMGDMLSLIEKAEASFDAKQAAETAAKMRGGDFTLEDFLGQMQQFRTMGSMQDLLKMMPGAAANKLSEAELDERLTARNIAILQAMTPKERREPSILNASRRRRIAAGSGVSIQEVNRLLNQFESSRKMLKQLMGGKMQKRMQRGFKPFGF